MIATIKLFVHLTDGTMFSAEERSFESIQEQLGKIERKIEKLTAVDKEGEIPF